MACYWMTLTITSIKLNIAYSFIITIQQTNCPHESKDTDIFEWHITIRPQRPSVSSKQLNPYTIQNVIIILKILRHLTSLKYVTSVISPSKPSELFLGRYEKLCLHGKSQHNLAFGWSGCKGNTSRTCYCSMKSVSVITLNVTRLFVNIWRNKNILTIIEKFPQNCSVQHRLGCRFFSIFL